MRQRVVGLAIAVAAALGGCAGPRAPEQPPVPPRPAAPVKVFDYTQHSLAEIDAAHIHERLLQMQPAPTPESGEPQPAPEATPPAAPPDSPGPEPRRLARRYTRYWHVPGWVEHHRCSEWCDHRRHYHEHGISLGNTLLYGTLGGIIGHQSGHRDEGILWGLGIGLLQDLWGW